MKIVKIFSILGLVIMAAACGSSTPTTTGLNAYGTTGVNTGFYNGSGMLLIGGQQMVNGTSVAASAAVSAGDHLNINLAGISYGVYDATCGSQWYNTVHIYNPPAGAYIPLTNVTVTFNGQAISGSFTAPTAGTVTLSASLDPSPFDVRCTALYDNQVANIVSYKVNLGSAVTR